MSVSLSMAIAIAKKYAGQAGDSEVIRQEIEQITKEMNNKVDGVDITSTGINFKANNDVVKTIEFITREDVSGIINAL